MSCSGFNTDGCQKRFTTVPRASRFEAVDCYEHMFRKWGRCPHTPKDSQGLHTNTFHPMPQQMYDAGVWGEAPFQKHIERQMVGAELCEAQARR